MRAKKGVQSLHEPEDTWLDSEELTYFRFLVPMRDKKGVQALHEPEDTWLDSEELTYFRFLVPMRDKKGVQALHEPACTAGFPACRFTGLSSPVDQERATGKSPGPAGSKACATNPPRFTVPMRAKKGVGPLHEPEDTWLDSEEL